MTLGNIRIMHTSGLHLASSFKGLPAHLGNLRRRDLTQTLGRLTDICRNEQTDLFLISGDIWEQANTTRPLVDFIADQFRKIPATKVLIAPGKTDGKYEDSFLSHYPWPENVHIFSGDLSCIELPHLNLQAYGMAWEATAHHTPNWSLLADQATHGRQILIVAYGNPDSLAIPQWLLSIKNIIYIALGGEQQYTHWGEKVCDPGHPEPLDFSCTGTYGVLTGIIGSTHALELMPTASRSFHSLDIDVRNCSNIEEVAGEIAKALSDYEADRDLFELRLKGIRPRSEWDMSQLQSMLKAQYVSVRDETDTYYDFKALEAEHSRGVLGKYITAVKGAGYDEKIIRSALTLGVDALLSGRVPNGDGR